MDWKDLPDGKVEDYLKIFDNTDKPFIASVIRDFVQKDPKGVKIHECICEWIKDKQKGLLLSYMDGIKALRQDVFDIPFHQFTLFIYISMNFKEGDDINIEEQQDIELKPQSIQLQKELDDMYTNDNINNAIDELGIFTKEDT